MSIWSNYITNCYFFSILSFRLLFYKHIVIHGSIFTSSDEYATYFLPKHGIFSTEIWDENITQNFITAAQQRKSNASLAEPLATAQASESVSEQTDVVAMTSESMEAAQTERRESSRVDTNSEVYLRWELKNSHQ